jgi:hypothetical protein
MPFTTYGFSIADNETGLEIGCRGQWTGEVQKIPTGLIIILDMNSSLAEFSTDLIFTLKFLDAIDVLFS